MRLLRVVLVAAALAPVSLQAQSAEEVGKTAGNIATKPLKDANVVKTEIPPKLLGVMAQPYSLAGLKTCADFGREIGELTAVLGPDVDTVQPKKGTTTSEVVLAGIEDVAGGFIPGTRIIRKVSGAEAEAKKAQAAVYAGSLRRAYIKGTARAKGCKISRVAWGGRPAAKLPSPPGRKGRRKVALQSCAVGHIDKGSPEGLPFRVLAGPSASPRAFP